MCDCEREKLCRGGPQRKKNRYSNILRYSRAAAAAAAGSSVASVASAAAAGAGTTSCMCHWNWCTWTLLDMNGAREEGRGRGIASKGTETKVAAAVPCETVTTACVCVCVHMCICVCVCVCVLCFTISKLENRMENPLEATRSCHLLYSSDNAHWNCLAIDHNNNVLCPVISALGVSVSVSVIERCDPATRFLGQCVIWTEFQIVLDNIMKISI